ncbi:hypothetical protein [Pseudenterobacter timonensis]|uniref:Uncharacterized protein n=1 Tax=Pseudenterobacter timonensis TaxID=1755099 RepID=A0ABV4A7H4_9ENTR
MKKDPRPILVIALLGLAGCSSSQPDEVEHIQHMPVPVVQPSGRAPQIPLSQMASLYQRNQQELTTLTTSIKARYLQDVKPRDIFDERSDVQRVYASLTRLEQLQMLNEQYFKEKNDRGLQEIEDLLSPLMQG